jgi:hypothetical protein
VDVHFKIETELKTIAAGNQTFKRLKAGIMQPMPQSARPADAKPAAIFWRSGQ